MKRILMMVTCLSIVGTGLAQTAAPTVSAPSAMDKYIYTWAQSSSGLFGTQPAGMNVAVYARTTEIGERPITATASLYKAGSKGDIFDCINYEITGISKEQVTMKLIKAMKFVPKNEMSKSAFEFADMDDAQSKTFGYSLICGIDSLGTTIDKKVETLQIPIDTIFKLATDEKIYATFKVSGTKVTPEITLPK